LGFAPQNAFLRELVLILFKQKARLKTVLCVLFAGLLIALPKPIKADTLWEHNHSKMRVVQNNNVIEIYYESPRHDLQERGVKQGTLLYRGTVMNGQISGTARAFFSNCPAPIEYDIAGKFTSEQLISLRGMRPLVDACKPTTRATEENLSFFYLSKTDSVKVTPQDNAAPNGFQASLQSQTTSKIRLTKIGGVYAVPLELNGHVTLYGIVDSGASDVSIPLDIIKAMKEEKIISEKDFLDEKLYMMADGSKVAAKRYMIKSVKVGEKELKNVTISSTSQNGVILLGQSFLSRFKSWSIDNQEHALLLD